MITKDLVATAIEELQWVPFEERMQQGQAAPVATEPKPREAIGDTGYFELKFGNEAISEHELPLGRIVIGRTPDNDIQIPSKFVSRHHAQVTTDAEGSILEDLNSTNGMFMNSRRIKRYKLSDGDVIYLGEHKLVYHTVRDRTGEHAAADADEAQDAGDPAGTDAPDEAESVQPPGAAESGGATRGKATDVPDVIETEEETEI